MLSGTCICGEVSWKLFSKVEGATACNCSACSRYGVLWAYGHLNEDVEVAGHSKSFVRGNEIEFHFCEHCGSMAFWKGRGPSENGKIRIAVNLRLADPKSVADIPIDHFDGLNTFTDLPRDGKKVSDYWA
jgi:hypothetical protein